MPPKQFVWQHERDEITKAEVDSLVEALLRNYFQTDPAKGPDGEIRKHEIAEQTIDLWWRLYDILVFWAQSHIIGKVWVESNLDLAHRLAKLWGVERFTYDSHVLERIGSDHGASRGNLEDPIFMFLAKNEELDEKTQLTQPVLRAAMRELLSSDARKSHFWREPLCNALHALNFGQIIDPLVPVESRRRAEFFETLELKGEALCRVNLMIGRGMKKHVALERVAVVLNQSPETLRSWEKLLKADDEFSAKSYAARLAGEYEKEIENGEIERLENEYGDQGFRNTSYWQLAKTQLARSKNITLERIRDELNAVRAINKMGVKHRAKIPKKRC